LLWIGKARHHLLRSQWDQAIACFGRVIDKVPFGDHWLEYAAVQTLSGDLEAYRKTCRKYIDEQSKNRDALYRLARTCCLTADSGATGEQLIQWAKQGAGNQPQGYHMHTQGAASFRAGQWAAAIKIFEASNRTNWTHGYFLNWYYQAMAHHHLGNDAQARDFLTKANNYMDQLTATVAGDAVDLFEPDWVEAPLLRQEAERTLAAAK
jgi:tetratricopeptide (TPR) repeat protein